MDREIKSLDIGTMHLISASLTKDHQIRYKKLRNAFLKVQVQASMAGLLQQEAMQCVEIGQDFYALGDSAFKMAAVTAKSVSRPMQDGVLNPKEKRAEIILKLLIEGLIGQAQGEGALCYYSVPAEPFQSEKRLVYHSEIIHSILEELGYSATAVNEGMAVVYSGLAERRFTGIGISCGCGLLNVCVSYKGQSVEAFSIDRAGDWIDDNASKAIGETAGKVLATKEGGFNLLAPVDRTEKALAIYYKELIRYSVECIKTRLSSGARLAVYKKPLHIVCAGGTALPAGFIALFRSEIRKARLPFKVEVVSLVKDPLYAIARGCLTRAVVDDRSRFLSQCTAFRRAKCQSRKSKPAKRKARPGKAPRKRKKAR
ncbi:MAG: hypothetical protein HQL20_07000 [Candidatus Omnitrophica bacterium]|nr:hypothetical protein [Candidatus Omnitrophota bacterium]